MRLRAAVVVVCAFGSFALAASPAPAATPQGPAPAFCLGWQNVVRADGTTFTSRADCIAYAATGGTLILPPNASCTVGLGAQAGNQLIWTCSVSGGTLIEQLVSIAVLNAACAVVGGRSTESAGGATTVVSCYRS